MSDVTQIHTGKTPTRLHYIVEWAAKRGITQAKLARRLEVDKSTVFRWFQGQLPSERHIIGIAEMFAVEPTDLFRHPDDDWLTRLLKSKPQAERERIEQAIRILLAS